MLLAIDTATQMVGIALHDGSQIRSEHVWQGRHHHTVELAPEVALLLRRSRIETRDLDLVAVARGPGSYTGLRIGMALAKGIALAHVLPLIAVGTLDILARGQPPREEPMLAVLRAGRGRLAALWYRWEDAGWQAQSEAVATTWDEVLESLKENIYVCGEVEPELRERLSLEPRIALASPANCIRRPGILAELAYERARSAEKPAAAEVAPIYLGSVEGTKS